MRTPLASTAAALLTLAAAAIAPTHADASLGTSCGHAKLRTAIGTVNARIYERHSSCGAAKRIAKRYSSTPTSRCGGSGCYVAWHDGWSCISTSGAVWVQSQKMFGCAHGAMTVTAYARSPQS